MANPNEIDDLPKVTAEGYRFNPNLSKTHKKREVGQSKKL